MSCICLKEYGPDPPAYNCVTKESFTPSNDCITDFCKKPDKFKNCPTYKEWTRIQGAPKTIKSLTISITILFYLVVLSILLTLGKITISDWNNQILVGFFGIVSVIIGLVLSKKT